MREIVVDGGSGGREGFDALGLALVDGPRDVLGDVLAEGEDAAVADGAVGAEEGWWRGGELVGEVMRGRGEMGVGGCVLK